MTDACDAVLNVMAGSYVNRWRMTDEQADVWREGLKGFSREVLRIACNHVRADFPEWPPTLMEFRRYCISERDKDDEWSNDSTLAEKWNKWADEQNGNGFKLRHKLPGETLEEYRKYLVMEFDRQKRGIGQRDQLAVIAANAKKNREQRALHKKMLGRDQ